MEKPRRQLAVWISGELFDAFDAFVRQRGTNKTVVVERAIAAVVTNEAAADRLLRVPLRLNLIEPRRRRRSRKT